MFFRFRYFGLCFFALFLTSCQNVTPPAPVEALPYILVTPNPQGTTTPTPFQPTHNTESTLTLPNATFSYISATLAENVKITATFTPWAINTHQTETKSDFIYATPNFSGDKWEDYPEPAYYPISTTIPSPVGMFSQPKNQINILLLGSDIRPYSSDFRTDTIILLTIDKNEGTVNLTSFPRDLYVYIPGWTMQRINTAMARGYDSLGMTMAYNFGVYPDYYVMVDFSHFIEIIDSLGGVEVEVEQNFSDQRTGYGWYQVQQGTVQMDGETALWYIRSRYTSNDIDRLRRAQEIIQAIGYRLLRFDILKRAPALYRLYKESVFTNLDLENTLSLLPTAKKLVAKQNITRYAIGYGPVYDWTEPYSGAMLLLPNRELLMPIIKQALNIP